MLQTKDTASHDPDLIILFELPVTLDRCGSPRCLIDRRRRVGIILCFFESAVPRRRYRRTKDTTSCYAMPRIRRMQRGRPTRLMHRLAHVTMVTSRVSSYIRCCFQHHGQETTGSFGSSRVRCRSLNTVHPFLCFISNICFFSKEEREEWRFYKVCSTKVSKIRDVNDRQK